MAIDVSKMSREDKIATLSAGAHEAGRKRKAQEEAQGIQRKTPIFQARGLVVYRTKEDPKAPAQENQKLQDLTNNTVDSLTATAYKRQRPAASMANFQDLTPESQQGTDIAQKTLDAYIASPQRQAAMQREQDWVNARQSGQAASDTPPKDETLERLQAAARKEQAQKETSSSKSNDQSIYEKDMADLNAMSEDERKTLRSYGNYLRIQRQDASSEMGPDPGEEEPIPREYQALVDKYGADRLAQLAETSTRSYQMEQRENVQAAAKQNSNGVLASILTSVGNLVTSPVSGLVALAGRLDEAKDRTGRYSSLSPYTYGDAMNVYADTSKQNIQQQIEGDDPNILRKGASLLYQAGTGALESAAKAITLGPTVAAATSAMNQYTRTLSEASERGATSGQATLLASSSAALDYVMDKIPMDRLFGLAKEGSTSALKAALKQAGIEVSTEGASFIGSQLLDMAILQENSEYEQNIQNYMAQDPNRSYADAKRLANKDLIAQAGQQLLVAGISGGVSAGVSTAIGNARSRRAKAQQTRLDAEAAPEAAPDTTPADAVQEQTSAPQPETTPEASTDQLLQDPQQPQQEPSLTPEQIRAAQQERDIQAEADRIRYEDQKSRAKARKDLQKDIEKTQADVDAGKGSPARLRQLQDKLYQMDMDEADYPRTRQEAITQQAALVDSLSQEQHDAYIRRETGEASNRPNKTATNRLKAAKAELDRLRNLSDADYAQELSDMGLSGNTRAPWLDSASANLEALGEANAARQADLVQSMADRVREASAPDQPEARPESVPDLNAATDYLRSRLNPEQGQPNRRPVQPQQNAASPTDAVSNLVRETTTQRRAQQDAALQSVRDQAAALTGGPAAAAQPDTLGMQSEPSGDVEKSRTVTNSGLQNKDADIRAGYRETLRQDREAGDYQVKHNADTLDTAQQRTSSPERVRAEYDYLMSKGDSWTAEDVATGRLVAKELFKSGDVEGVTAMNKQLAKVGTNAGQVAQAFAISGTMKDASDPMSASESATARFLAMDQGDTTYKKTKNGPTFEQWQNNVTQEYTRIAMAVDSVPDGDVKAMRDVIRQIAQSRKTTAWFGTSSRLTKNAQRILNKLDFDTLKKIANTQIAAMPDDFRARGKMEVAEGLRKQGMLSSLKTFERNLAGNSATGLLDSFSDSIGGRFVDSLMAKATGKRTVGNDLKLPGKYLSAAKDSMDFASLCVELNVPIETDANAAFDSATGANGSGKYIGKTFRSNGNVAMRVLYGYQKYMSYALEVSDKVFEGGTNAAVTDSLNRLKNSNLSDAEISELAEFTANRRTFKDATWEENGKTHGSNLSRIAQQMKNVGKGTGLEPVTKAIGDTVLPFASVPMNVAQTGVDYTAGIGKGAVEIASILKDARAGKEISVARQRQAASDFGRGATGMAFMGIMAGAAAKGIIQVHNDSDKNKKALDQSQGLSGAQINWSALGRASEGGSEKWQTGDVVTSLDFLEPFNTQMYLAVELSEEDTMQDILKAYPGATFRSVVSSFMDSPMVDGLTQLTDLISNVSDAAQSDSAGDVKNAFAEYGGNVASSFIPQFVRQTAQTMDGYYRDTRGADSAEYAKNSVLNAIPGASESLPKKVNGFGQEQKRGGFVSNFLDPTNTHRLQLDKTAQSLDELSQNPDVKNIYPERQAPLKVKDASGEDVQLTAEQRETYQKEYGKRVKEYYDGLLKNASFDNLSDEMKAEALQKAKEYGTQFARAAVTDYKDVPKDGGKTSIVFDTVRDVLKSNAASAVGDLEKAWEFGNDTKKATDTLNAVYDTISKMPGITKKSVLEKSSGNTRIYLEARNSGFSSDTTLSIIRAVQSIPEKNRGKRPVQLQSVASTKGLSDAQLDTAMKLYMPDYDPTDKEPDKTEVKYDYIRKELGLSAKEYADTYYAYLYSDTDGDGKSLKDDKVQGIIDLGFDKKMAEQLYYIYAGSGNKTKAAIAKFIEGNY